ncbi:MAG TPA: peptidoglycan-binding domain-containing protein [Vicinamibacterales bacterium]|nr:peptidoglycan-binding domain-containing protein [Vicinamibacterales bacterium]
MRKFTLMNSSTLGVLAALLCSAALSFFSAVSLTAQDPRNQTPATPANKTPAKPAEPAPVPGTPLHISPGIVKLIQGKLVSMGHPIPTVSGAWGELSAKGLAEFQRKQGLDPGGDLDELTLTALGMPEVLRGEVPAGGDAPVSAPAAATGGAPLAVSPRLTRVVQNKLTQFGFPTHNVVGIWITEIDNSPRNFQKSKGLDVTNTLDLQLLHALDLTESLTNPQPGKLPTDAITEVLTDDALLLTGTPLRISAVGLRQVQTALIRQGHKEITADGKWSDGVSAAVKKFQESQKLDATGSLDLRTLRALGFAHPLSELDRPK